MKIEAVVFDWGGVLAGNVADRAAEVEQRFGLAPGSLPALLGLDPYDTDLTNLWHRRELGQATALEWAQWYSARLAAAGGPTVPAEMLVATERERFTLTPNQAILDALPRLKDAGYRLAICTNNFLETRDFWQAGLPLDLFDAIVVSCDLGVRKPDPEMFEHVSDALQTHAEAIVLLDDLPANIAGAATRRMAHRPRRSRPAAGDRGTRPNTRPGWMSRRLVRCLSRRRRRGAERYRTRWPAGIPASYGQCPCARCVLLRCRAAAHHGTLGLWTVRADAALDARPIPLDETCGFARQVVTPRACLAENLWSSTPEVVGISARPKPV